MAIISKKDGGRGRRWICGAALVYCFVLGGPSLWSGPSALRAAELSKEATQSPGGAVPAEPTRAGQAPAAVGAGPNAGGAAGLANPPSGAAASQGASKAVADSGTNQGEAEFSAAWRKLVENRSQPTPQTKADDAEVQRKTEQTVSRVEGKHRMLIGVLVVVLCAAGLAMWMALREHRGQLPTPQAKNGRPPFPPRRL